jgi:hypothetical protein
MKKTKSRLWYFLLSCIVLTAAIVLVFSLAAVKRPDLHSCASIARSPSIKPDYVDVTVPPNIAPLNFIIEEPGDAFFVRLTGEAGQCIDVISKNPVVKIPMNKWKKLLFANKARSYQMDICVKRGKQWSRFAPITNLIAAERIDPYLTYRKLPTMFYNPNPEMGIYQRNIETFEERVLLHRRDVGNDCINCHISSANQASTTLFHVRRPHDMGPGMVIVHNGIVRFETHSLTPRGLISLTSIHPNGKVMAFAAVKMGFFSFMGGGSNNDRLQFEYSADLGLYDIETGEIKFIPGLSTPDYNETWPNWSGDGKYLYFSRCKVTWPMPKPGEEKVLPKNYKDVKYDLMRAPYYTETKTFGEPEMLLSSQDAGKSCLQPSVSFDGRFVAFFLTDYGVFPINNPESDMYVMDMKTRTYKAMACNSPQSESMVRWSSNDRWILFGSKRRDILYTRLYFAYVDVNGQSRRAVELPQEDPMKDETDLRLFTTASLLTEPVNYDKNKVIRAILSQNASEPANPSQRKADGNMPGEQQR